MAEYEQRDIQVPIVVAAVSGLVLICVTLLAVLYGVFQNSVEDFGGGPGLPVVTPGEPTVNQRLNALPQPRLDGLRALTEQPPTVSPSDREAKGNSPDYHPEDMRPERQAQLQEYRWVDREKGVATIPIERAMKLVAAGKTGGAR